MAAVRVFRDDAPNPADFRFNGVDGRGRQELVQDPRQSRGAAVVRIQDSEGGSEGYTFDLEWRGTGFGSNPVGQPADWQRSLELAERRCPCLPGCRQGKSNQQYGLSGIDFRDLNADDNPGRNDAIVGSFEARRGNYRDTYRFSCSVDLANGRVRGVEISQRRDIGTADRYAGRDAAMSACRACGRTEDPARRIPRRAIRLVERRQSPETAGSSGPPGRSGATTGAPMTSILGAR